MLVISREEVKSLVPVEDAIEIVGNAYVELVNGTAKVPERIGVSSRGEKGTMLIMPGYLSEDDSLAVKVVSVFPANKDREIPAIHGVLLVIDPETGKPLALIEAGYLTALRTGASCGLATDLLARQDASAVAMIGAGAQSRLIVPAACAVRNIDKVFVFDRNEEMIGIFIDEMEPVLGSVTFTAAASPGEAVRDADIVCTATTSITPVFDGADLVGGCHINGIGSFKPEMQEIGLESIRRCSKIVVDSLSGAMAEAGDLLIAIKKGVLSQDDIFGEIGEILNGCKPGRENDSEITFFKSVGNAALDVAVGAEIFRRAVANGRGVSVDL